MIDFAVRQLHRAGAERHAGEFFRHIGHVAQGIEKLLGGEQLGDGVREVFVVVLVEVVSVLKAAELIGRRICRIVRIKCFASHFFSTKSLVKAANRSSLADGLESRKSSTGSTIPLPIRWNQMRFTIDFGTNGFSGEDIHLPSDSRRSLPTAISGTLPPMNFGAMAFCVRGWMTSPLRST